jgi:O-antigen/teichoic acid export membrane protein
LISGEISQLDRTRVGKNIASSYLNQASALIATIVLVLVFTRLLGQQVYGEWLIILAIVSNVYLIISGFDQTIANRIAEAEAGGDRAQIGTTVSTILLFYAVIACVLILAFDLLVPALCRLFVSGDVASAARPMLTFATLLALALPFRAHLMLLRGLERVYEEQRIAIGTNVCRIVLIPATLLLGLKLLCVSVVYGLTTLCGGLAACWRACRISNAARFRVASVSAPTLGAVVKPSVAFALLQAAGTIGFGIDSLVIGYALGPEQVTRYSVPFSMMMVGTRAFSTLTMALLPTMTASYALGDNAGVRHALGVLLRISVLYAGAISILLWISGR